LLSSTKSRLSTITGADPSEGMKLVIKVPLPT